MQAGVDAAGFVEVTRGAAEANEGDAQDTAARQASSGSKDAVSGWRSRCRKLLLGRPCKQ